MHNVVLLSGLVGAGCPGFLQNLQRAIQGGRAGHIQLVIVRTRRGITRGDLDVQRSRAALNVITLDRERADTTAGIDRTRVAHITNDRAMTAQGAMGVHGHIAFQGSPWRTGIPHFQRPAADRSAILRTAGAIINHRAALEIPVGDAVPCSSKRSC
ncbi:hypothetical protein B1757_10220 [Acidithiobacillus marinus]|uniref:Uncharacterized protein n=1 Tax=Acidithiobacillus marinus TaxID=187490 RepID=A0A2I1DKP9_9PROT|nr:hypothetical protein B1757_10220 [Acidithiobacillus marinus]